MSSNSHYCGGEFDLATHCRTRRYSASNVNIMIIAEVFAVCCHGRVFMSRLSIFFHRCGRVFVNMLVQRWMRMTEERPNK